MATEISLQIVSGFSREDLRDTFRKDQRGDRVWVTVTVRIPAENVGVLLNSLPLRDFGVEGYSKVDLRLMLDTVGWEDGSGHSWNLTGFIQNPGIKPTRFKAYYHTSNRNGNLTVMV